MLNPIRRVKESVVQHKTKIVYGAGIITGVAGAMIVRRNIPVHVFAPIPSEMLQHLIDHVDDSAHYIDPKTHVMITLFNSVNLAER